MVPLTTQSTIRCGISPFDIHHVTPYYLEAKLGPVGQFLTVSAKNFNRKPM